MELGAGGTTRIVEKHETPTRGGGALLLGFAGLAVAVVVAVQEFPRGLSALACVALAWVAAWYGILRSGAVRVVGMSVGALGLGVAIVLLLSDRLLEELLVVAALVLSCACARAAFGVRAPLLMDIFEVEQKERLSREEVAVRLRKLADMLARTTTSSSSAAEMRFTVNVPDTVQLKIELEVETDERELEIELTW